MKLEDIYADKKLNKRKTRALKWRLLRFGMKMVRANFCNLSSTVDLHNPSQVLPISFVDEGGNIWYAIGAYGCLLSPTIKNFTLNDVRRIAYDINGDVSDKVINTDHCYAIIFDWLLEEAQKINDNDSIKLGLLSHRKRQVSTYHGFINKTDTLESILIEADLAESVH